jgi:hypothetical protein
MQRKALSSITLSDGTYIPQGAILSSLTTPIQLDPEFYGPTAKEFDGFRSSRVREEEEGELLKHQVVTLKPEFQIWGFGKHAWFVFPPPLTSLLLPLLLSSPSVALRDNI